MSQTVQQPLSTLPTTGQQMLEVARMQLAIFEELLDEIRSINNKIAAVGEGRSSTEIERNTKGANFKVKVYDQSPIRPAEEQAVDAYNRMVRRFGGEPSADLPEDL